MKYWEIIADEIVASGWTWGCCTLLARRADHTSGEEVTGPACQILDVGRGIARTGEALFEERTEIVAVEWLRQVIIESGHSRLVDIGRIRVA